MRLSRLFVGSLIVGGVLAATALSTDPEPVREEPVIGVRSVPQTPAPGPARDYRVRCPPHGIAPACQPGVMLKYILWDTR